MGKWRYPAFGAFVLYFMLTIALPTLILLWRSLVRFYVMPSWSALAQVTMKNYWEVFGEEQIVPALINTLIVGVTTATLTMLLCLVVAWVIVRSKSKVARCSTA